MHEIHVVMFDNFLRLLFHSHSVEYVLLSPNRS